jgi:hypothetical protein
MEKTREHANIMCDMIDKLRDAGVMDDILDTSAEAA